MSHRSVVALVAFALAVGALGTWSVMTWRTHRIPNRWFATGKAQIGYSNESFFESEIALPAIQSTSGKVKFVLAERPARSVQLGYVVTVAVKALDKSKLPAKYTKREKQKTASGDEVEWDPIEHVLYQVTFTFDLKNEDGFTILSVSSKPESLSSGTTNEFQGLAPVGVPPDIAQRTQKVEFQMSVDKCITCSP